MKTPLEIKAYHKAWRLRNPVREAGYRAKSKEWIRQDRKRHPEKYLALSKLYRSNPDNKKRAAATKHLYNKTHKDQNRNGNLVRDYGLTLEDYNARLLEQHGVCFICHRPETRSNPYGGIQPLVVDHDHLTGENRQLLCHRCNAALGMADDNSDRLRALAEYVDAHRSKEQAA